jgi:3-deoxy-D-manno-octulosonic-acid transferase
MGAALRVHDAAELLEQAARLLTEPESRERMGERALAFAGHHRGATARTVEFLRRLID